MGCSERILELLEGGVGGNGVSHVLCPLWLELVVRETVHEGHSRTLEGIDSKEGQAGSVLERGEGLVESKPLRESLGALGTELIAAHAAQRTQQDVKGY